MSVFTLTFQTRELWQLRHRFFNPLELERKLASFGYSRAVPWAGEEGVYRRSFTLENGQYDPEWVWRTFDIHLQELDPDEEGSTSFAGLILDKVIVTVSDFRLVRKYEERQYDYSITASRVSSLRGLKVELEICFNGKFQIAADGFRFFLMRFTLMLKINKECLKAEKLVSNEHNYPAAFRRIRRIRNLALDILHAD